MSDAQDQPIPSNALGDSAQPLDANLADGEVATAAEPPSAAGAAHARSSDDPFIRPEQPADTTARRRRQRRRAIGSLVATALVAGVVWVTLVLVNDVTRPRENDDGQHPEATSPDNNATATASNDGNTGNDGNAATPINGNRPTNASGNANNATTGNADVDPNDSPRPILAPSELSPDVPDLPNRSEGQARFNGRLTDDVGQPLADVPVFLAFRRNDDPGDGLNDDATNQPQPIAWAPAMPAPSLLARTDADGRFAFRALEGGRVVTIWALPPFHRAAVLADETIRPDARDPAPVRLIAMRWGVIDGAVRTRAPGDEQRNGQPIVDFSVLALRVPADTSDSALAAIVDDWKQRLDTAPSLDPFASGAHALGRGDGVEVARATFHSRSGGFMLPVGRGRFVLLVGAPAHRAAVSRPVALELGGFPSISLECERAFFVTGRVVDAVDTATSVAGAYVAVRASDGAGQTVQTRADGRFQIDVAGPGVYSLNTWHDAYLRPARADLRVLEDGTCDPALATLQLDPRRVLTGTILRGEADRVEGASVRVGSTRGMERPRAMRTLVTDSEGRFRAIGLDADFAEVHIGGAGAHLEHRRIVRVDADTTGLEPIALEPAAQLDLWIAIAGDVITDENDVPVTDPRTFAIELAWLGTTADGEALRLTRPLDPDGLLPTDSPLASSTYNIGPRRVVKTVDAASRRLRIGGLLPGRYRLSVLPGGGAATSPIAQREFSIAAGKLHTEEVALDAGGALLGSVNDEDGKQMTGARITVTRVGGYERRLVITGVDGAFAIGGLAPGVYVARASRIGWGDARTEITITEADIESGRPVRARLTLLVGVAMSLRVLDPDGRAAVGALVELDGPPRGAYEVMPSGVSDANGYTVITGLRDGAYGLRVHHQGAFSELGLRAWLPSDRAIVVRLKPGSTVRVRVQARDGEAGEGSAPVAPARRASVRLDPHPEADPRPISRAAGTTADDGTLAIADVGPGRYRVTVECDGFAPLVSETTVAADGAGGEERLFEVNRGLTVAGSIEWLKRAGGDGGDGDGDNEEDGEDGQDDPNRPLPTCSVVLTIGTFVWSARVRDDGTFAIRGAVAGTGRISVVDARTSERLASNPITLRVSLSQLVLRIVRSTRVALSGTLLGPDRVPLARALLVAVKRDSFGAPVTARTAADGAFTLEGLERTGTYDVRAQTATGQPIEPVFVLALDGPATGIELRADEVVVGAIVTRVMPDGIAGRAGLREGDRLVKVNDTRVRSSAECSLAIARAQAAEPNAMIRVDVERGGHVIPLEIPPGDWAAAFR